MDMWNVAMERRDKKLLWKLGLEWGDGYCFRYINKGRYISFIVCGKSIGNMWYYLVCMSFTFSSVDYKTTLECVHKPNAHMDTENEEEEFEDDEVYLLALITCCFIVCSSGRRG
ncbi:hypothetical protein MKW92_016472 [Papaver armeniacum]|nr:hypothetical protein MKW92_016472 [Papaver armeniacum]